MRVGVTLVTMFRGAADPETGLFRTALSRLRSNDIFRHGALVLAATLLLNAAAFLFHALVSRNLGVTQYGSLYAVISLALLASFPAGIVNTVIAKFAAEFRALHDAPHLRALTATVCKVFSIGLLLYVGVGIAFAHTMGGFLRIPGWEVVLAAAMAGAVVFVYALRGVAQGTQDFSGFSTALIMDGGLKGTLGIWLATATVGLAGGLLGFFAGTVVSGGYTLWRLHVQYGRAPRTEFRVNLLRVFSTTAGAAALMASTAILSYGDVVVVRHFFGAHEAGIYAAASLSGKILLFLVSFAPTVLIPKAVDSHSRGEKSAAAFGGAIGMVIVLSAAGLIAFLFGAKLLLLVLVGAQFIDAAPLLPWYGCAMSLLGMTNVVAAYSIALHRFAFGVPLVALALTEIVAIVAYHPTLYSVVAILVVGNALALGATVIALVLQSAFMKPRRP